MPRLSSFLVFSLKQKKVRYNRDATRYRYRSLLIEIWLDD